MKLLTASPLLVVLVVLLSTATQAMNYTFPAGSPWYQDVSAATLDSNSANVISYLNGQGGWGASGASFQIDTSINIQYATASTPFYTYSKNSGYYSPDCDNLATFPVVPGGEIEGEVAYNAACTDDCHYLVVDTVHNKLYESYNTQVNTATSTISGLCAVEWNLCQLYPVNGRGDQCTSTDAAGFPIAPLLVTADELAAGNVPHALRFIMPNKVMRKGYYVHPATHAGGPSSTNANAIIYGSRLRLKSTFNATAALTSQPPSAATLAVVAALKKYGMFLADGGNIPLTFADDKFTTHKYTNINFGTHSLFCIKVTDFDVVAHTTPITVTDDCVRSTLSGC